MPLFIKNICGYGDTIIQLNFDSASEISQFCSTSIPNSSCNGGNLPLSYNKYEYKGTYQLPGNCTDWNFSFNYNYREFADNIQGKTSLYVETTLNNTVSSNNSSPYVTDLFQIPTLVNGQTIQLSNYIIDPDQDSLTFSLVSALENQAVPITYASSLTGNNPMPNISINSATGQLSVLNQFDGKYIITVLVNEYSNQGNLKGTFLHDFIINTRSNSNNMPIMNGISNFNNFGTYASFSDYNIEVGNGDQFCFDIEVSDNDANDSLFITSDLLAVLPNATINFSGNNPIIATICGAYTPSLKHASFSIKTLDNYCPAPGSTSQVISLTLGDYTLSNQKNETNIKNTALIYKAANKIYIESSTTNGVIYVYDISGKLMIKKTLNNNKTQIDLNFPPQIFIVKLFDAAGNLIQTQKL